MAESIGRELLVYGRRVPKAEMFARIDAVDADTVRAVADRFIYDQDVAIAAVGDTQFLPDYNWCAACCCQGVLVRGGRRGMHVCWVGLQCAEKQAMPVLCCCRFRRRTYWIRY